MSPILAAHICGGTLGLASGAAALTFPKGSRWHALAGKVFALSMLTMATSAVYLAIVRHQPGNFWGGILTLYLIGTAWLTARRRDGETSKFDWAVVLIPLVVGILSWIAGLEKAWSPTPPKDGVPAGMHLFMGSVMLLAAAGDIRMLLRGGLFGRQRIARHLWRMCFGLFIAAGSFFLGGANRPLRLLSAIGIGQHLSPAVFNTPLYLILSVLPLVFLIFWTIRVRYTSSYKTMAIPQGGGHSSAPM